MAEGLVGIRVAGLVGHRVLVGVHRRRVRGAVVVAVGLGRASTEGLVGVGRLLGGDTTLVAVVVVVGRAARAAAHTEGPEQHGTEGEDHGQPGGCQHVLAQIQVDTVSLEDRAQAGLEDREQDGRGDRGGGGEEEGDNGSQSGDTAAPTAADGEDTEQNLQDGGHKGDHVGNELPLGDGLVDLHDLGVVTGQFILDAGVLQAPNLEGVEVEGTLGLGALGGGVLVAAGDVAVTVTPQTDRVEVLQSAVILQLAQHIRHLVLVDVGDAGLLENIFDFLDRF